MQFCKHLRYGHTVEINARYHSRAANGSLHLQPAKTKSQPFWVSIKFFGLELNVLRMRVRLFYESSESMSLSLRV